MDIRHDFRQAMRCVVSPVAVLTVADCIGGAAMTMTAVSSLSMDPPSLLVAVNRQAAAFPVLLRGAGFCVNFLKEDQQSLAGLCSDPAARQDRLNHAAFAMDDQNMPYVRDALVSIFCEQDGRHLYGSHAIVIGRVRATLTDAESVPLTYLQGRYASAR